MAGGFTPVRMYQGQPGTSDAALVSAITGNRIVKQIIMANTTSSAADLTINMVPNPGTTSSAANQIVPDVTIPANTVITLDLTLVMNVSDAIRGLQGTASAITVTISGVSW
jgi:hypothetical protein